MTSLWQLFVLDVSLCRWHPRRCRKTWYGRMIYNPIALKMVTTTWAGKKKERCVCYYWCCCFDWVICCCLFESHRLLIRNVVEAILYIMKISERISFLVLLYRDFYAYSSSLFSSRFRKEEVITTFLLSVFLSVSHSLSRSRYISMLISVGCHLLFFSSVSCLSDSTIMSIFIALIIKRHSGYKRHDWAT